MQTGYALGALSNSRGGSWCCTALNKRKEMEIRHVKAFRHWHMQQFRVRQEGYHIWGRIVEDKWVHNSQVAAEGVKDYYSLSVQKKVTFRGLLAWLVMTPPAMLIASYIILAQNLNRVFGRSDVRGITS